MLNGLVLTNRPPKHFTLPRIGRCAFKRQLAKADRFRANQNAFRVEAMQQIVKALAFFADQICGRDLETINKQGVGVDGLAAHLVDHMHIHRRTVHVGVKKADAIRRLAHIRKRCCPRQ